MSWFRFTILAALALPGLAVLGCDGQGGDDDYTGPLTRSDRSASAERNEPSEADEDLAMATAEADEARADAAQDRREVAGNADDEGDRFTEAQVLGIARALNQGEVDHSRAVQARLANADLRSLAEMMITEHGAGVSKIDQVGKELGIVPTPSKKAADLAKDVQDKIEALRDKDGADLEDVYLSDQKGMHEQALEIFDDELLPAAVTPRVVQLLTELRTSVATHLEHIKRIEAGR